MTDLLPLLPTLIALARTGSVSRAARELGIPRSTVSRRLSRIEEVTGLRVAERSTRSLRLTAAGRRLVDGAAHAMAHLQTVYEAALARDGEIRGNIRIAMSAGASGAFMGEFFAFLEKRHPGIDIELIVTEQRTLRLEDGVDFCLVLGQPESSAWLRRRLGETRVLAVASPRYLQRKGTPTRVDALGEHMLLTTTTPGIAPSWPKLRGGRLGIKPHLLASDMSVLRDAAVAGMGIALLPAHIVMFELESGRLVHVLPSGIGQDVPIFALYLPERRTSPVLRAVLKAVDEFVSQQTTPAL